MKIDEPNSRFLMFYSLMNKSAQSDSEGQSKAHFNKFRINLRTVWNCCECSEP